LRENDERAGAGYARVLLGQVESGILQSTSFIIVVAIIPFFAECSETIAVEKLFIVLKILCLVDSARMKMQQDT